MVALGARYWSNIGGSNTQRLGNASLRRAVAYSSHLRYLKGGGGGCAYPDEELSPTRRRLHAATAYGFAALLLSTISAGISQHVFGANPPYPIVSVPVGLGIAGGAGIVVGCTGLIILKRRADPTPSDAQMGIGDYGLLLALDLLAITGLLTLALRDTPAFGIVLVAHLAMVVTAFAIAPYTKFMHAIYRFLSILKDNTERAAGRLG